MAVSVLIPTPLRKFTQNEDTVQIEANSIAQMLKVLEQNYPGMKTPLRADDGSLRRSVNIFVNDENSYFLQGIETVLNDGDEVSILPHFVGG